ncbi:MAG TPA: hypothetical protein VG900_03055 [Hyphomicrobiaceae bacterium]|nr:hypothetical protein [Hyphomicrobiaceae bacterium]
MRAFPVRIATRHVKQIISGVTAVALVLAQVPAAFAAPSLTRSDYDACQARDDQGFRIAVEAITRKGLESVLVGLDYDALVKDQWRRANIDDAIDRQVDQAIGEVRDESSWMQLWQSLASKEKAQELATTAAERVYRSDSMKKALEGVAAGLGKEIGSRIEVAIADTAGPASQCMQMFLGPRYGTTIARIVSTGAGKEYTFDPAKNVAAVSTGQVLAEGSEGIAGTVILVVRRQLTNMAARIGQRIVGSILSRLVSVVAGGVGLVLIAKDIWDFRHGVLPIISEEMKSPATKEKVRAELVSSVREQIADNVKDISSRTADRVLEIWLEFRRAHAKVVELAERQSAFKQFIDTVGAQELPRADELVNLVLAREGEDGVLKRVADGTLHSAIHSMPAGGLEIARETRSLETALQWNAVAGDHLAKVVDYEIYRRATPESFTKAGLDRLLALEDRLAVTRLASLKPAARDVLFELESSELKKLARALTQEELDSLSRYLTGLDKSSAHRVLRAVSQTPARMALLARARVREAILSSSDQSAAVGMMLQTTSLPDPGVLLDHAQLVLDGRVNPLLLWLKHPVAISATLVLALVVLLFFKRLLFGRRPRYARGLLRRQA